MDNVTQRDGFDATADKCSATYDAPVIEGNDAPAAPSPYQPQATIVEERNDNNALLTNDGGPSWLMIIFCASVLMTLLTSHAMILVLDLSFWTVVLPVTAMMTFFTLVQFFQPPWPYSDTWAAYKNAQLAATSADGCMLESRGRDVGVLPPLTVLNSVAGLPMDVPDNECVQYRAYFTPLSIRYPRFYAVAPVVLPLLTICGIFTLFPDCILCALMLFAGAYMFGNHVVAHVLAALVVHRAGVPLLPMAVRMLVIDYIGLYVWDEDAVLLHEFKETCVDAARTVAHQLQPHMAEQASALARRSDLSVFTRISAFVTYVYYLFASTIHLMFR